MQHFRALGDASSAGTLLEPQAHETPMNGGDTIHQEEWLQPNILSSLLFDSVDTRPTILHLQVNRLKALSQIGSFL